MAKTRRLTVDEFMAKHESELAESDQVRSVQQFYALFPRRTNRPKNVLAWFETPSPERDAYLKARATAPDNLLIGELKRWWPVRLLKAAKMENSPEAYRELLEDLLIKLGAEAPEGVFTAPRGSPGAPRKHATEQIYWTWIKKGRPKPAELAGAFYEREFLTADTKVRKKLRDRVRQAVERSKKQLATKSPSN